MHRCANILYLVLIKVINVIAVHYLSVLTFWHTVCAAGRLKEADMQLNISLFL